MDYLNYILITILTLLVFIIMYLVYRRKYMKTVIDYSLA